MINSPDFFYQIEYENKREKRRRRRRRKKKEKKCPTQMADLKPDSSNDLYVAFRP